MDSAEANEELSRAAAWTANVVILMAIAGFPLSLLAWIIYPPLDSHPLYVRLGVGLAAWVLLVPIAWLATRRRRGRGWFLALVITGGIGLPMFSFGSLGVANALLDASAPTERRARVLRKKKLRERSNSHPYRLHVKSWRPGQRSHELVVERELWNEATIGQEVIVLEKPGALGWPWEDGVRLPGPAGRR